MNVWQRLWTRIKIHLWFHSGIAFVYRQLCLRPPSIPPGTSLEGRTVIITGANTGLGFEAGRQLLQLGLSRLILATRSHEKGIIAAEKLRRESPQAQVDAWVLNLEDYESVRSFAAQCEAELDRIDIVILNAGVQNVTRHVSYKTGHEQTLQVNYLSTVLLALLLLPLLKRSKESTMSGNNTVPRLTFVSSTLAYFASLDQSSPLFPQLDCGAYDMSKWYGREKLMLMVFAVELAKRIHEDDIVINVVCPGLVGTTEIWRDINNSSMMRYAFAVYFALFGRSLPAGASTYIDATVLRGRESHGAFLSDWTRCP